MNDFKGQNPLGKPTSYASDYDPGLLCPVGRRHKRSEISLPDVLPFHGVDIWNAYELSWLTPKGKPVIATGEFRIPCESPNIIESKSLKLYLNSFNQKRFDNVLDVQEVLRRDLSGCAGWPVEVRLFSPSEFDGMKFSQLPGESLDDLDIAITNYSMDPSLLKKALTPHQKVKETLKTHLLKSNCLVTGQPDWASVMIRYEGGKIDPEALLRYLISYRMHNEFHEQCVERIFCDLMHFCKPNHLTVYARYTRRGGLDINPFRSNFEFNVENLRLVRQ